MVGRNRHHPRPSPGSSRLGFPGWWCAAPVLLACGWIGGRDRRTVLLACGWMRCGGAFVSCGGGATTDAEHGDYEFLLDRPNPRTSFSLAVGSPVMGLALIPAISFSLAVGVSWGAPLLSFSLAVGSGRWSADRGRNAPTYRVLPALSVRAGSGVHRGRVVRDRPVALAWPGGRGRRLAGLLREFPCNSLWRLHASRGGAVLAVMSPGAIRRPGRRLGVETEPTGIDRSSSAGHGLPVIPCRFRPCHLWLKRGQGLHSGVPGIVSRPPCPKSP